MEGNALTDPILEVTYLTPCICKIHRILKLLFIDRSGKKHSTNKNDGSMQSTVCTKQPISKLFTLMGYLKPKYFDHYRSYSKIQRVLQKPVMYSSI
jgi:hypothetical protein